LLDSLAPIESLEQEKYSCI